MRYQGCWTVWDGGAEDLHWCCKNPLEQEHSTVLRDLGNLECYQSVCAIGTFADTLQRRTVTLASCLPNLPGEQRPLVQSQQHGVLSTGMLTTKVPTHTFSPCIKWDWPDATIKVSITGDRGQDNIPEGRCMPRFSLGVERNRMIWNILGI